ncbi:MAG: hypothetical protein ABFR82_04455 [Nitrospirota bacterium]
MNNKKLAAIDIGTNTFRLLIASVNFNPRNNSYSFKEIFSERIITRIGDGIHANRLLGEDAINRSISALCKFSDIIASHDVFMTSAVATSALREADNSSIFIQKIREAAGLEIRIISGNEEAAITSSGMLINVSPPESALMADIGGGSTELIFYSRGKLLRTLSVNLGVVYMANKYMTKDPPSHIDRDKMDKEISAVIIEKAAGLKDLKKDTTVFLGTAGTVTALAAMTQNLSVFDHSRVHNYILPLKKVKEIFTVISALSSAEREKHIPFELARLDIIVPGTRILLKLMETFGFNEITVSNYGLREGILIDLYKKMAGKEDGTEI